MDAKLRNARELALPASYVHGHECYDGLKACMRAPRTVRALLSFRLVCSEFGEPVNRKRKLSQILIFIALMVAPTLAWAAGGEESGAGRFAEILQSHGAILAVVASFGFGIVASLTPCVYPMVSITVSIFGATQATSRVRGALLSATFVLGITCLFVPMGLLSAATGRLMGSALSNPFVVMGFAVMFMALAASMFGAFEIALPSALVNRLSTVGGVGYKGAFAMGLVMGLVAMPCTGPFLTGMLAVIASTHSYVLGTSALFSFGLGLGIIFFVVGAFAINLPKGGAWMMGIKWASGVVFAYMAFAFLRDRFDVVRGLVAYPGYAFGAVAAVVFFVGLGLGVAHVMAERRKSPIAHLSKTMKLASIVPAVAGAAMFVSWVPLNHDRALEIQNAPEIAWLTNEEAGLAKALAEGKPVLIDFGADWCVNCKELDHETFPNLAVRTEAERFVAIRIEDDDSPDFPRLQQKYGVVGLPTVIMLDKTGKEILRINEFVPPNRFVAALKKVPAG
jgi:thiol:disulfide interchange protein DsbD